MKYLVIGLIVIGTVLIALGEQSSSPLPTPSPQDASVQAADAVAQDIVHSRIKSLYGRMEGGFRERVSKDELADVVQLTHQMAGGLREVRFRAKEEGMKFGLDGGSQALWKFWYAADSKQGADDSIFLVIEIVLDGSHYACSTFSILTFPGGPPPHLIGDS